MFPCYSKCPGALTQLQKESQQSGSRKKTLSNCGLAKLQSGLRSDTEKEHPKRVHIRAKKAACKYALRLSHSPRHAHPLQEHHVLLISDLLLPGWRQQLGQGVCWWQQQKQMWSGGQLCPGLPRRSLLRQLCPERGVKRWLWRGFW